MFNEPNLTIGLLVVGSPGVLDPVDEEALVLLQDEELAQDHVGFVEAVRHEPPPDVFADAGERRDRLVPKRFSLKFEQ